MSGHVNLTICMQRTIFLIGEQHRFEIVSQYQRGRLRACLSYDFGGHKIGWNLAMDRMFHNIIMREEEYPLWKAWKCFLHCSSTRFYMLFMLVWTYQFPSLSSFRFTFAMFYTPRLARSSCFGTSHRNVLNISSQQREHATTHSQHDDEAEVIQRRKNAENFVLKSIFRRLRWQLIW